MSVFDLRREYVRGGLSRSDLDPDPIRQLEVWLEQARVTEIPDATAMTLATADRRGRPSARIVLLKGLDRRGLVFFTNYESRKGRELAENPWAALVFYWAPLDRQVRIEGTVERTSRKESADYFATRPLGARLGAWASRQSRAIAGREDLESAVRELEQRFGADPIPLPDFWGGFRLRPEAFEFWQGRESRLHDRFRYERLGEGWSVARLSP